MKDFEKDIDKIQAASIRISSASDLIGELFSTAFSDNFESVINNKDGKLDCYKMYSWFANYYVLLQSALYGVSCTLREKSDLIDDNCTTMLMRLKEQE